MKVDREAKALLNDCEIVSIDIRRHLNFAGRNKNKNKNDEKFIKWLIWLLDKYDSKDATIVYANTRINDYLNKHLSPMTWLNYSPTTDDNLADNEIMVRLEK